MPTPRIVADLGNSRLKWARVDANGRVGTVTALPATEPDAWASAWDADGGLEPSSWAISTVNPPAAAELGEFLRARGVERVHWCRSAADVRVRHALATPGTTGADRALAVAAAIAAHPAGTPGLVVLCGTAVTVERIAPGGLWEGGAIAAGLGLTARALHSQTAQLPRVNPSTIPAPWGNATRPAIEAGVYWGVVGAIRELLTRQSAGLGGVPWVAWSGGDAEILAGSVDWPGATVIHDLVLRGLAGPGTA